MKRACGTLFMIPVPLGDVAWQTCLPAQTRDLACGLTHFVAESAKTARAHLKALGHPVGLRDLEIVQLPVTPTPADVESLLAPLIAGHDVGLMSEAGCAGVADPGAPLVARAHQLDIPVRALVGPSSILMALMASGLDGQCFAFHGYLPVREPERGRKILELEADSRRNRRTQIFIETPYRNNAMFQALTKTCAASTRLTVATDLTLTCESVRTRRIAEWRTAPAPSLDRRPTVFLLLSAD